MQMLIHTQTQDEAKSSFESAYVDIIPTDVPKTIEDCKRSNDWKHWKLAIKSELSSLLQRQVFQGPMELPMGKQLVGNRWVFVIKRNDDGSIARYKARLVAQGFSQRPGFDYGATYSPVMDLVSYRYILALGTQLNFEIDSMDVVTAYLYGDLEEEIYMKVPEGIYVDPNIKIPCVKIAKALYGLKQSGRQWYLKFAQSLVNQGYQYSDVNPCIFYKSIAIGNNVHRVITSIYVDDSIIMGDQIAKQQAKKDISRSFDMKDLGSLKSCIGIQVVQTSEGIFIHQKPYLIKVLERFNMLNAHPRLNPLEVRGKFDIYGPKADDEAPLSYKVPYASAIGALSYLANSTRPEISYAVNVLARNTHAPTKRHWLGIKHVLRYLNGTRDHGLWYRRMNQLSTGEYKGLDIVGYADAGYLSDWTTGKSQSGVLFTIGGTAFSWRSVKQTITATSTMNAEIIALFDATKEAVWISNFIIDLYKGLKIDHKALPITIYEDNQACISQIKSGYIKSNMNKHLSPKFYFTSDMQTMGRIKVAPISSSNNLADIFTKILPGPRHRDLRHQIGVRSLEEITANHK